MRLQVDWNDFKTQLESYIVQGDDLHEGNKRIKTENDLNEFELIYDSWSKEVYSYLNSSFDELRNEFAHEFHYSTPNRFHIEGERKLQVRIKEKLEDTRNKVKVLRYFLKLLSVSDSIIKWNEIDLESRKNFTTDEILEFILEKLYALYDDKYHSIATILEGNGIVLGRQGEEHELGKTLKNYGLVNIVATTRDVSAQLSIEGKRYVEENRRAKKTDYTKITEDYDEISQKIDELKDELNKLGLGQEILFNELEELKELYPKLKNKNWGEILKGKLIDLGLAQVISKKTMSKIFEVLTTEILYLP